MSSCCSLCACVCLGVRVFFCKESNRSLSQKCILTRLVIRGKGQGGNSPSCNFSSWGEGTGHAYGGKVQDMPMGGRCRICLWGEGAGYAYGGKVQDIPMGGRCRICLWGKVQDMPMGEGAGYAYGGKAQDMPMGERHRI